MLVLQKSLHHVRIMYSIVATVIYMPAVHLPQHYPNRKYYVSPKKAVQTNWIVRLAGVAFLCTMAWNLLWVLTSLNLQSKFQTVLTMLFTIATLMIFVNAVMHVINNW